MELIAGAAIAFVIAALTVPVGISGAFLLVPVQLSVLGVPAALVAPTNLVFNVVSIPGAMVPFERPRRRLAAELLGGSLPGVVLGTVLREEVLDHPDLLLAVVAVVLAPMGVWLLLRRGEGAERSPLPSVAIVGLALFAGVVGGLYGIGGGSIVAPVLVATGLSVAVVAPAALLATFATSVIGVFAFVALGASFDWQLGIALGLGGAVGSYTGARLQPLIPEPILCRLLGAIALLLAAKYAIQAAT